MKAESEKSPTFDPHLFAKAATDVDFFRSLLPPEVEQIVNTPPPTISLLDELISDEKHLIDEVFHREALRLWNRGSEIIHSSIYQRYAKKVDLVTADFTDNSSVPALHPKIFDEISAEESARWISWLGDAEFKRTDIIEALRTLTQGSVLPPWEIINNPENRSLYEKLVKTPHLLALVFIPDLTPIEVGTILKLHYSKDDIKALPAKIHLL